MKSNLLLIIKHTLLQGRIQTLTKGVLEWEGLYNGKATVSVRNAEVGVECGSAEAGAIRIFFDTRNTVRCNNSYDYVTGLC